MSDITNYASQPHANENAAGAPLSESHTTQDTSIIKEDKEKIKVQRKSKGAFSIDVSVGRTRLTIISIILILCVMYFAKTLVLPVLIGMFFALLLNPLVAVLRKLYLPRGLASIIVLFSFIISLGAALSVLFEPAEAWVSKVPELTRELSSHIDEAAEPFTGGGDERAWYMLKRDEQPAVSGRVMDQLTSLMATGLASVTPVFVVQFLTVIVLVLFFLIHGNGFYRNVIRALPSYSQKKTLVVIGRAIQFQISHYVFVISCINFLLGLATTVVLYLLGVEDPILWGALATIFNYVPYVGPLVVTILLTLVGFTQFDSAWQAVQVPIAFTILNNLECQFVTPMILGARFKVNPLIVVLWLLIVGWMWGVTGMILAVPMLVSMKIIVSQMNSMKHWRKLLS